MDWVYAVLRLNNPLWSVNPFKIEEHPSYE